MNKVIFHLIICTSITFLSSCSDSLSNKSPKGNIVKDLVTVGYSIKELSIRTNYPEEILIKAFHGNSTILDDSAKNEKIARIYKLNDKGKIIPVNKCNLSAYNALWKIYEKAQNLPRASLFTGIGVTKVGSALMKRKPLDENDSIRALVGYVNVLYNLGEMPPTLGEYYSQLSTMDDVVIPVSYHSPYSDQVKKKVDYYLYLSEQFELRANENLKKTLQQKFNNRVNTAVEDFVSKDVSSILNTTRTLFKDSLEKIDYYSQKLSKRLALLEDLESEINQEVLSYYISMCCSRALLVEEALHYKGYSNRISAVEKVDLLKYINQLEEITSIVKMQQKNLIVDASIGIGGLALTACPLPQTKAVASLRYISEFLLQMLAFEGLDHTIKKAIGFYYSNEDSIANMSIQMSERIVNDIVNHSDSILNSEDGLYMELNKNTKDYYDNVRNTLHLN